MKGLLRAYFKISLMLRIFIAFIVGIIFGAVLWYLSSKTGLDLAFITSIITPFGVVFVHMLKMVVLPVIFFSLVIGTVSLPISKLGSVGVKVLAWYLLCSFFVAILGLGIAVLINPGSGTNLDSWQSLAHHFQDTVNQTRGTTNDQNVLLKLIYDLFKNPFEALATGNFLSVIVLSILMGLAMRVVMERSEEKTSDNIRSLVKLFESLRLVTFKIVDWILEYSPIGVFALTTTNFAIHGPAIVGPYVQVTLGVIVGIIIVMFVGYPFLLAIFTRQNPYAIIRKMRKAMLMAFVTRSSAATLPVSLQVAHEELKIREELSSFSLPLGATINMDGVCVHLAMFAVLATNLFGIELSLSSMVIVVLTTVLSSIGAGGVPGGSLMLLFIILGALGLDAEQTSLIVAIALGINPILDMFETMNNITGDLVCTYAVAKSENMLEVSEN